MYPPLAVIVFSIQSLIMYGVQLTDGGVTPKEVEVIANEMCSQVIANEMCSQDFEGKYSIFSYNLGWKHMVKRF